MAFTKSDIELCYSSLTIGKDHPDYDLMCVYEELCRKNYQIIAKAQKNIETGIHLIPHMIPHMIHRILG